MADLRSRFIEDYAGGLLNISRQEISTTGEVLAQDGLTSDGTLFVEDGSGTKSGLKLGVSLAEAIDPTTEMGVVNVRYADRTYAKVRDLKIFSTAIASAQAALSEASSTSISNLEITVQLLEDDITTPEQNFQESLTSESRQLQELSLTQKEMRDSLTSTRASLLTLEGRVSALEVPVPNPPAISTLNVETNSLYYSGTIAISGGVVTGTSTAFDTELDVGDSFIATTSTGEIVEFIVTAFGSTSPSTSMTVIPTNKVVSATTKFTRNQNLELKKKVNEIISALKTLNFFV